MQRDFKGVWIPKEIWLDDNLGWSEKLLLVEIDSLTSNEKGCFATNDYFADFFKLSKDRISKLISSLKNKGYIEVELKYKKGTKQIEERLITTRGYRQKQLEGIGKNNDRGIVENAEDNNTVFNNTENNTHNNECVENSEITDKQAEYRNKVESKKLIIKDLITLNRLNLNIDKITEACKGNFDLVIQNIKTVCQNRSKFGNLEGAIMSSIKVGYEVKIKPDKTPKSEFEFNQERFDRINKLVEVADISALTNKDRDYYNKCQEYLRG